MADELDALFAPLRQVTAVLTDPTALRATADRRTAIRRAAIAGLSTAAVILTLTIAGFTLRHNTSAPPVLPGTSTSAQPSGEPSLSQAPSTEPSPTEPPSTEPPSTASSAKPGGTHACAPSDFDSRPYYGTEGAMGNAYQSVAVRNVGGSACTVAQSPVLIGVNERTGRTERIPMDNDSSTKPVTIPRGQWGYFTIHTINGFGGFEPSDPACANPRSYRDVVLMLDGARFALRGFKQSWQCLTAEAIGWKTAPDRPPFPTETRAP